MNHDKPAYGLWSLVIINSAIFLLFAFSFFKPRTTRDWRTFGKFAAFIVALFVEMYGFPLTIICCRDGSHAAFPVSIHSGTMPAICGTRSSVSRATRISIPSTLLAM